MQLLLGSGGLTTPERLKAWREAAETFLGSVNRVLFVPYALADAQAYAQAVKNRGLVGAREVVGIHQATSPQQAVREADALFVGGGNSFRLLNALYDKDLLKIIRERVAEGMPYLGVSAGTNMACPTLKTTNDMPIVAPPSFEALGLIPFQINPHYFSGPIHIKTEETYVQYGGETRDDRLNQFHEENAVPVLGLWEGAILLLEDRKLVLKGSAGARLFRKGQPPVDLSPEEGKGPGETLLQDLLKAPAI